MMLTGRPSRGRIPLLCSGVDDRLELADRRLDAGPVHKGEATEHCYSCVDTVQLLRQHLVPGALEQERVELGLDRFAALNVAFPIFRVEAILKFQESGAVLR